MIVTSKRCFLNVLTQLWNAERLLCANYYVGDQSATNGFASFNDQIGYNEFGQLISRSDPQSSAVPFASRWHVKMSKCLDPEPFRAQQLIVGYDENEYSCAEERFVTNHLNNPDTLLNVYNFLFKDPLEGNGIQILMFNDDSNLLTFGHIICQYLSINFGCDITFIDPAYRPDCRGYTSYKGDKQLGLKTIKDVRDYDLLLNFSQAVSQSSYFNSVNNLRLFLGELDFGKTMYLWTLLWPNDPLPPGNYTIDHVREMIIGRCTSGNVSSEKKLPNLMLNDWQSVLARAEREDADCYDDDSYS